MSFQFDSSLVLVGTNAESERTFNKFKQEIVI